MGLGEDAEFEDLGAGQLLDSLFLGFHGNPKIEELDTA